MIAIDGDVCDPWSCTALVVYIVEVEQAKF